MLVGVQQDDDGRRRKALPAHLLGAPRDVGGQRLGQVVKALDGPAETA